MKTTNRANRGKTFEAVIDASQGNVVRLDRVGQAAKWVGPKVIAQKGPVDYTGTVCGSGRAICFDAKMCDLVGRFPAGNADHLPEHQREHIIRHGEAGAVSGVLVWATKRGAYFWMSWEQLLANVPSHPWEALQRIGDDSRTVDFAAVPGVRPAGKAETK